MARKKRSTSPPVAASVARPRSHVWLVGAGLALLTIAAFTPVWRFDFVALDDPPYVYGNNNIKGGLSWASVMWALTTGHEANWHPLTWLSHIVDVQLFGMWAGGHHAVNLLIHVASTVLLFGVMRRLTGSFWRSAFVAAIFGIHPLHVESVAWISERKDVLSGLFFVLTVGAYVRWVESPSRGRYVLITVLLALGLMSKPMLVTLPMVLLLLDYWPLKRQRPWSALALEKAPLFALAAASSVITFFVQKDFGAVMSLDLRPFTVRIQNAIVSYAQYLIDVFWPADMAVFYPLPVSLPPLEVAASAAVLLAITTAVWWLGRRFPFGIVGWLWFVGMLVPVSGISQAGAQARADRFMYLPLIGLSIGIAWAVVHAATTPARRRIVAAAGVAAVAACAFVTHAQTQHWRDTVALWSHTARATEGSANFGVYVSLGEYLREYGRPADSIVWFEGALQRNPRYALGYLGLGRARIALGELDRAAAALTESVRLNPASAEARMALGVVLYDLGRPGEAIEHLSETVRLRPEIAEGHWRLALSYAATGRLPEALPEFAEAARLDPATAAIRNDFGWALVQHGQTKEGIAQLREALRLKPDSVDALHNLGRVLAALDQTPEALTHLSEAVRLEPGFVDARISLARALIGAGRTDDAARELREVLKIDPRHAGAQKLLAAIGR